MAVRWGAVAYGVAIGTELLAAVLVLVVALARRPRDLTVLSLVAPTLLTAGLTALLCVFPQSPPCQAGFVSLNAPFAVASLTSFLPFVWCVGLAWRQAGDGYLSPAVVVLIATLLFGANRYDSLVASRYFDTIFVQPFVFAFVAVGVAAYAIRVGVATENALTEAETLAELRRLRTSATDGPNAIRQALALVGPMAGAYRVRARLRLSAGPAQRFDWHAEHSPLSGGVVTTVRVVDGDVLWGTLHFVSRAPPAGAPIDRMLVESIAGEIAELLRNLRTLANQREAIAADERNRIARELHDSVSQTLYSIAMVADALPGALERDPAIARDHARQIRSMTLQALGDTRVLLLEMRHDALEAATLGGLLEQFGSSPAGPVVVELDVIGATDLPDDVKLAAWRVAQEAVTNAQRHALPHLIRVRLVQRPGEVTLSIDDDGGGFEAGPPLPGRHGMQIMRERAADVGADLEIASQLGEGTSVRFRWESPAGGSGSDDR